MNKHTFDSGYVRLEAFFNTRENITKYETYWDRLKSLPDYAFERAVDQWIDGEGRFPTIKQLKVMSFANMTVEDRIGDAEIKVSPEEMAMAKELAPMFLDYLNGKTQMDEWLIQLRWVATRHGQVEKVDAVIAELQEEGKLDERLDREFQEEEAGDTGPAPDDGREGLEGGPGGAHGPGEAVERSGGQAHGAVDPDPPAEGGDQAAENSGWSFDTEDFELT